MFEMRFMFVILNESIYIVEKKNSQRFSSSDFLNQSSGNKS